MFSQLFQKFFREPISVKLFEVKYWVFFCSSNLVAVGYVFVPHKHIFSIIIFKAEILI